jgi:hypothetical protein
VQQRVAPIRVELGEHVVEQQHRRGGGSPRHHLVGGQPQGQREGPLLALGGVGAGREPVEAEVEIVAVGADGGHTAAQVVAPRGRQSRRQPLGHPGRVVGGHHLAGRRATRA